MCQIDLTSHVHICTWGICTCICKVWSFTKWAKKRFPLFFNYGSPLNLTEKFPWLLQNFFFSIFQYFFQCFILKNTVELKITEKTSDIQIMKNFNINNSFLVSCAKFQVFQSMREQWRQDCMIFPGVFFFFFFFCANSRYNFFFVGNGYAVEVEVFVVSVCICKGGGGEGFDWKAF